MVTAYGNQHRMLVLFLSRKKDMGIFSISKLYVDGQVG